MSVTIVDLVKYLPAQFVPYVLLVLFLLYTLGKSVRKNIIAIHPKCDLLTKPGVFSERAIEVKGGLSFFRKRLLRFKSLFNPIIIINPQTSDYKFADWVVVPLELNYDYKNRLNETEVSSISALY